MVGRIKRQQRLASAQTPAPQDLPVCPLCGRDIPLSEQDAHHFIPKSKGGRETRLLHRICHRQIHALYSETELARRLHTAEALLAEPDMQTFVAWVRRKPVDFFEKSRKSAARRRA
jgi:5-methylcytosine-specific restriction endonuclease McrA